MKPQKTIKAQLFRASKALVTTALTAASSAVTIASSTTSIAQQIAQIGSQKARGALSKGTRSVKQGLATVSKLKPSKNVARGIGIAAVAAGVLTVGTILALKRIREQRTISFPTKNGKARVYEVNDDNGFPVRLLEVDGIVQSGTYVNDGNEPEDTPAYTDLVFNYLKQYDRVFEKKKDIQNICVLGCGGYDYPKHLIAHHAPVCVDAVEIDPTITALAERYFYLDRLKEEYDIDENDRLHLITNDALIHLLETGPHYDAIINDTYDGGSVPLHLASYPFYTAVKRRLNPDGVFATNIVSPLQGPDSGFLKQQVDLMKMVFDHVEVIPCDSEHPYTEDNVVVFAS